MPISRKLLVALALLGCGACNGGSDAGSTSSVGCAAPAPTVPAPALPDGIPTPAGVVYTAVSRDASVLTAKGYAPGAVDDVVDAYRAAFENHPSLVLQADHGELRISGPSTQGSVTLARVCDRVGVDLELRPLTGP